MKTVLRKEPVHLFEKQMHRHAAVFHGKRPYWIALVPEGAALALRPRLARVTKPT